MRVENRSFPLPKALILAGLLVLAGCGQGQDASTTGVESAAPDPASQATAVQLTDAQVEEIVRRSYQFVAMYNVNNKNAMDPSNPKACRTKTGCHWYAVTTTLTS